MKIALIFPNINIGKILRISSHPPLGLAYLAAVVERAGYSVFVIDAAALNLNYSQLLARLEDINPDVIGITTNILSASHSLTLCRLIRKQFPSIKLVLGGPWASAVYEMILNKRYCDYVIIGEGEIAFVELLKVLEKGQIPSKLSGVAYRENKSVQLEPPCLIEDLDSLPFPAWQYFPPPKKYLFHARRNIFYPIMTSRGCPFNCNHCTKIVHGNRLRYRSIENVIAEIQYLKDKFSVKEITIIDDNFTLNAKRAEKICDEIIKRDFKLLIQFSNGVRADTLTPTLIRKLKKAGTYKMAIGVESGNQDVVNKIGKRLDLNAVRRAVKLIKQEKIILYAFFIIGHPFDTLVTMNDTIRFALEIDPEYPHFFKAIAFPGTQLFDLIQKEGKFLMSLQDIERGYNTGAANFEIYDLHASDVEKIFKEAYRRFYLRPRKILTLLSHVRGYTELKYILNFGLLTILNLFNLKR
ncbi:MAG: B12-binding domain-containing radical SAM protein [Candidatus Helarchaeota archaeon]